MSDLRVGKPVDAIEQEHGAAQRGQASQDLAEALKLPGGVYLGIGFRFRRGEAFQLRGGADAFGTNPPPALMIDGQIGCCLEEIGVRVTDLFRIGMFQ